MQGRWAKYMIHYHVWFSLKPEMSEEEGLRFAKSFIEELRSQGKLARGILLKNTGEAPKSRLLRFHALFEFKDDEQMTAAFADKRKEGIHAGPHGKLMEAVSEFRVEVFREV